MSDDTNSFFSWALAAICLSDLDFLTVLRLCHLYWITAMCSTQSVTWRGFWKYSWVENETTKIFYHVKLIMYTLPVNRKTNLHACRIKSRCKHWFTKASTNCFAVCGTPCASYTIPIAVTHWSGVPKLRFLKPRGSGLCGGRQTNIVFTCWQTR